MRLTGLLLASAHGLQLQPSSTAAPRAPAPVCMAKSPRVPLRQLTEGDEWDGMVSKITDYGLFVRMGHEQHMGLVHVSTLTDERLDDVADFIETTVGPVGSKVRVVVLSTMFKGQKRVALQLLDVISRQHMEDVVFARPGDAPRDEMPGDQRGVDRYNDLPAEDDGEEDGNDGGDDEDEVWVELHEDDDMQALAASGVQLMDGLQIEDVQE